MKGQHGRLHLEHLKDHTGNPGAQLNAKVSDTTLTHVHNPHWRHGSVQGSSLFLPCSLVLPGCEVNGRAPPLSRCQAHSNESTNHGLKLGGKITLS